MAHQILGRDPFTRTSPAAEKQPLPDLHQAPKKKTHSPSSRAARPKKREPKMSALEQSPLSAQVVSAAHPASPSSPIQAYQPAPAADTGGLFEEVQDSEASVQSFLKASSRLACPKYYAEKLSEVGLRFHAEEVDPFGFDPVYWNKLEPVFRFLFESYWRVQLRGMENIPDQGRVLLVANHSGTLPYDGAMLKVAVEQGHSAKRSVRFLVEDFVFHFPFLGTIMNRIGGVRANPDNAQRLLELEQVVAVFPEGVKGIGKLFRDRYKLQRFGRGGFIKLALRTNTPILPVAVVGAEEIHPLLARVAWLAKPLGVPYIPVTPTFPFLGPLGAVPLPSRWFIEVGKPIDLEGALPDDAEDPLKVTRLSERVRESIQQMINNLLEVRQHPFWEK